MMPQLLQALKQEPSPLKPLEELKEVPGNGWNHGWHHGWNHWMWLSDSMLCGTCQVLVV
jgi:hypothetical protein